MAYKYTLLIFISLLVTKTSYFIGSILFHDSDAVTRLAGTLAFAIPLYAFSIFILRRANVVRVEGLDRPQQLENDRDD